MKKTAICLLLASCAWFSVGAAAANSISKYAEPQQSSRSIVYSGRIVDARNNTPLIGATIILKGTTIGASSDTEGNFRDPRYRRQFGMSNSKSPISAIDPKRFVP